MLKTFLKSDIKLNILIFLISVSAVFTFISLFCALNSGNAAYHNMMDRSGYIFDGIMPEDSPEFFRENLPEVYTAYADNAVVSYRSTENYICTESAKVAFNKSMKELYRFIQSDYNITDGRFFTEDELKGDSKAIIAENDCGINVGDRLIIPDDKGDIVLNVIGLSDDFIVPYSLIYHNNSGIYVKDEYFENEMKNTARQNTAAQAFFFTSDLSDNELQALEQYLGEEVYIQPPNRESHDSVIIIYAIITGGIVVTGIFTALLPLTLMLHLTDNCSEQINVLKVTGCKSMPITLLLSAVTLHTQLFHSSALLL
ncbi:MAG: ABC transporter permease [[Eubacterium] siraeum]